MNGNGAHRPHDIVVEGKQFARTFEQIPTLLVQFHAAALAPDDHDLAQHAFKPLHLK